MNATRFKMTTLAPIVLAGIALSAHAQQGPSVTGQTAWIGDDAVSNTSGRIAVNQASGVGNAQANIAVIALSPDGVAFADVDARQQVAPASGLVHARAVIDGAAFSNSHGVMSVNQAAGASNAQLNIIAIGSAGAIEIARASDAALAGTAPASTSPEGTATVMTERRAVIDFDAFRGTQGMVQVNQTAGVGNFSTNAIVLQLPSSTP